jgi:NodT family efflux transporter outer membrane factor (OMF) lipoprotein
MTDLLHLPALALAATALAGCAGSPPPMPAPHVTEAQWSADDPNLTNGAARLGWWREFGSADLDAAVDRALGANREIAAAEANLRVARALAGESRRTSGGVAAGLTRLRESSQSQPPIFITPEPFPNQTMANVGVDFAWELDLAGGEASMARSEQADSDAALWERRQTEAAIVAQVVQSWLDLAREQANGDLLRRRIAATDAMLAIGRKRIALGGALASELAQLEQLRAGLAGRLSLVEHAARNATRRIAVLTGQDPVALSLKGGPVTARKIKTPTRLTAHDPRILLRLRPDVQAAEARLLAAFERAGGSRAALYPSLSLGAGTSLVAAPRSLDERGAFRFSIGPSINWGIFNLGQVRARIRAADAASEAAAARWQNSLLVALEEADGAIDLWLSTRAAAAQLRVAQESAVAASAAIRARGRAGTAGAFELAEAEVTLLAAEADLMMAEAAQREAWARANLALGAGWQPEKNPEKTAGR